MNQKDFKIAPRVQSRSPKKNTIEWEIPNKVLVSLMMVENMGWLMVAKIKKEEKAWWRRNLEENFMESGPNSEMILRKGLLFLNKFGYSIDIDAIKEGERIGDSDFFEKTIEEYKEKIRGLIKTFEKSKFKDHRAVYVVYSTWIRAIMQIEGRLNPMRTYQVQMKPDLNPELHEYPLMIQEIEANMNFFTENGQTQKAMLFELWLYSLLVITFPELKPQVIELWDLLLTSKKDWNEKLEHFTNEDIRLGIDKEFVSKTRDLAEKILTCLPPKEIYL